MTWNELFNLLVQIDEDLVDLMALQLNNSLTRATSDPYTILQ